MTTSFSSIPILDLSLADDITTRPELLKQLHHALTEIGFMYVKNHGVDTEVISNMVNILPNMFALPLEVKDAVALHNSPQFLGYGHFSSEKTANATDLREQFEFATELPDKYVEGIEAPYIRLQGPNQWPNTNLNVRETVEAYITSLTILSDKFLTLVAAALSLPIGILHKFLSSQHRLKLVHYPSSTTVGQGVGPHKDSSGWWTFLLQASSPPIGGLQALNRAGEWIDVPSIPATFVVNIGQAFEVVSGGLCPATTHRVLSGKETRYSIPFFQGVRGDATKEEFKDLWGLLTEGKTREEKRNRIDSAFLSGDVETWGEWQLRTKIKSHPDVGKRFYSSIKLD